MTITAERAKALLDASKIKGATVAAESLAGERLPEVTDCGDGATIADHTPLDDRIGRVVYIRHTPLKETR